MGQQPRITGQILIPSWSTSGPNVVGTTTSGSPTVTSVSSIDNIIPGLVVTGTGITGRTVISVDYGASSFVLDSNASSSNVGITIGTTTGDGVFFCRSATYSEVNSTYTTADITDGFLITNIALFQKLG